MLAGEIFIVAVLVLFGVVVYKYVIPHLEEERRLFELREKERYEMIRRIKEEQEFVSPYLIIDILKYDNEVPGVYLLRNKENQKIYVGQSIHLRRRISDHINGRGNRDVYFDMRIGMEFEAAIVKFDNERFRDLDHQEKYFITLFDSYYNGYNNTRGNGPDVVVP